MIISRAFLAAALLGCGLVHASDLDKLARVWSASNVSMRDRAAAVNQAFTNGTPMSVVVAALGTNYVASAPISTVSVFRGPERAKTSGLLYGFGEKSAYISTTASISEDPLYG